MGGSIRCLRSPFFHFFLLKMKIHGVEVRVWDAIVILFLEVFLPVLVVVMVLFFYGFQLN